jgi:hypothetical protein
MLQAALQDQTAHHTRKQHNIKRTRADGVLLQKRDGQVAYLEYTTPFGVLYMPSRAGGLEQIQCRIGDSCFTIEGRHLWPLVEDLQAKLCDRLQEAEPQDAPIPAVPYIEALTIRLWL